MDRFPPEQTMRIWVTSKNHEWASEVTGLSLEEIKKRYEEAREKKITCTIITRLSFLSKDL